MTHKNVEEITRVEFFVSQQRRDNQVMQTEGKVEGQVVKQMVLFMSLLWFQPCPLCRKSPTLEGSELFKALCYIRKIVTKL